MKLSDSLLVAMVLKVLPQFFQPFAAHFTLQDEPITFAAFKTKWRSFEDTEKMRTAAGDKVMNMPLYQRGRPVSPRDHGAEKAAVDLVCFKCGLKGHLARTCKCKLWCSYCKSTTHLDTTCRLKQSRGRDDALKACGKTDNQDDEYAYQVS